MYYEILGEMIDFPEAANVLPNPLSDRSIRVTAFVADAEGDIVE